MSQKAVEGLLGRLLTDPGFRSRFYMEPAATCRADSLDITGRELEAVLVVDQRHVDLFAEHLDPRIVRAATQIGESVNPGGKAQVKAATAKLTAVK